MGIENDIGFIGAGKMGTALIEGVLARANVPPARIAFCETDSERREQVRDTHGINVLELEELASSCRVLMLCVKPNLVAGVLDRMKGVLAGGTTVVSIAAGITTAAIERRLPAGTAVVRAMPNIAATVGESATAVCRGSSAGDPDMEAAVSVLGCAGRVVELPESLMDAVTGLSGSGPAYVFLFAEALISGALKAGMPAAQARDLAVQTIRGAAAMLEANGDTHPATLRDAVTTPGGTTIAGLHELESGRFRDSVIRAVEAAARRSQELGKDN